MLENEDADAKYNEALGVLHGLASDLDATEEQRALARAKRDKLIREYIGKAIDDFRERTAKFREFIDDMNAVIAAFSPDSGLQDIADLKEVVDDAAKLIGVVRGKPRAAAKNAISKAPRKAAPKKSRAAKTAETRRTRAKAATGKRARPKPAPKLSKAQRGAKRARKPAARKTAKKSARQ